MTFLLKIREAAKGCSHIEHRNRLRWCADNIGFAIEDVYHNPTEDNMRLLNGLWAYGERALKEMPPEGTPAPQAPGGDCVLPEQLDALLEKKAA
jgi:hypothetical protein